MHAESLQIARKALIYSGSKTYIQLRYVLALECTWLLNAHYSNLTWELAEATLAADEQEEDPHEQEEDPSEDLESEEPVHSGSPGKRKRGVGRACRCGSTTHQRTSHKECRFYQKATHG